MTDAGPTRRGARLGMLAAATLWSGGGLGVKLLGGCGPLTIAGYRAVFAGLVLGLPLAVQPDLTETRRSLGRARVWAAAVSYAVMVVCFVVAAKLTTAANAILLQYTAPIYIALVAPRWLGEPVTARDVGAVLVTVAGMALFFVDALSAHNLGGNLVAVASSFGFAGLPVSLGLEVRARKRAGLAPDPGAPLLAMTLGNVLAAVACAPAMISAPPGAPREWAVLAALGIVQIGIPYLLYARAVRALPALDTALLASIEPILSPVWVLVATGERPTRLALLGGTLIVASVTLRAASERPRRA